VSHAIARQRRSDELDLTEWGHRVKQRRRQLELSQVGLVQRAGANLTQDKLSRIERGQVAPTYEQLIALSRALGVPVFVLFPFPADVA
jgi:transcriptional regulator with XRE-family HTH domain